MSLGKEGSHSQTEYSLFEIGKRKAGERKDYKRNTSKMLTRSMVIFDDWRIKSQVINKDYGLQSVT